MISAPAFWWQAGADPRALALWPIGFCYGRITAHRMLRKPSARADVPVICVGNYVVGGVGKTPFSQKLVRLLKAAGRSPAILMRGYGGRMKGPVLVEPGRHSVDDVGDEAFLLAAEAPTIVSADRVAGAVLAAAQGADLIIMDDGFQNPSLHKDISIALVDAAVGLGNGFCFPAGPLRAPLATQIRKTDVLVVVGKGTAADEVIHQSSRKAVPLLRAHIEAAPDEELLAAPVLAYAGIGRPEKFFESLAAMGAEIAQKRGFADHHVYSERDAQALLTEAEEKGLQLVTTSKDMARLENSRAEIHRWLAARSMVLPVEMTLDNETRLMELVEDVFRKRAFG